MPTDISEISAERFVEELEAYRSSDEVKKTEQDIKAGERRFIGSAEVMGTRIGQVFALAKEFIDMPPSEIEQLLENPIYEVRAGGLSIMGNQAARRKTPESRKKELFDLYLKHTDRIDSWQLVDISCHKVIGGYLLDKPRDVLYTLARSQNWCERRIAIYSTLLFIRAGDLDYAFKISEILLSDDQHFIHTAVGGILREAGKKDRLRLLNLLDQHAAMMPRILLRYAVEHLDKEHRDRYLSMKRPGRYTC